MMKRVDSSEIDLRDFTIGGLVKRIFKQDSTYRNSSPYLVDVWIGDVQPHQIKGMLCFLESHIRGRDKYDFTNLKRIRQVKTPRGKSLSILICSRFMFEKESDLISYMQKSYTKDLDFGCMNIRLTRVPINLPTTKDESHQWSDEFWPISWKGNPLHWELLHANLDLECEKRIIDQLVSFASNSKPITCGTIIAQSYSDGKVKLLTSTKDHRDEHPLHHSVMKAIESIASIERHNRLSFSDKDSELSYLCQDLVVYTTHEPCTMCCMGLVHSRIGRLVYIWPHEKGAVESSYFIGDRKDLNWKFEIWRWTGGVETVLNLSADVYP
ncbi:hypothetical protein QG37_04970 [Candidozyma auris]|nr:hypothetical protein QG37_04970 [[Candida] auris]